MKYNKNKLAIIILICVMAVSACTQSYSQAPAATPTLIPPDLFVSPFPSVENPMAMIEEFAKGTATAAGLTAAAGGGITGTPGTPQVTVIVTGTPGTPTNANVVATTSVVIGPSLTPLPPGVRPTTYTLQKDEFPYCIARRFNVDPAGLVYNRNSVYYQGLELTIPQSGSWPASAGPRALRTHPDTYTVTGNADNTVYGVACKYGDIDPATIAQNNGISVSAALTIGQQLKIP